MVKKKYPPSNKHQEAGWPYQQSQELLSDSKPWQKPKAEAVLDHVKHINPTTRRNPHVWIWNDARINSSGLIIIANLQDVNTKKQVIEVLERSGLSQNYINIQSIKICRWRAYIQLKNPKDVVKLNRFSKVKYPDNRDGNLVYIVHTPRRAFMKSGNWPLDMLFVIYHDKLKSEYHDILDYTKTIPGDVYFAISAMVKLSESKTVVALYRRCADFQILTKAPYKVGIKKVSMPTTEDLSELTAILNSKDLDPAKGWKFVRKSTLNPSAKTFYASTPTPQDLSQHPHPAAYTLNPDVKYYPAPTTGFGPRWSPVNLDQLPSSLPSPWGSGPFVAPSNVEARLRFMELTSPGGWTGAECMIAPRILLSPTSSLPPRPKTIRHILTPLTEALASQNSKYNSPNTKQKTTTKSLDHPVRSNPVASADWSKLVREANSANLTGTKLPFKNNFTSQENFLSPKKSIPRKRRVVSSGVRRRNEPTQPLPRRVVVESKAVDVGKSKTSHPHNSHSNRRKAMRAGTPESSSEVSLKDIQSSDIEFKEERPSQFSKKVRVARRNKNYPS